MLTKNFYNAIMRAVTKQTIKTGFVSYDGTVFDAYWISTISNGEFLLDYMKTLKASSNITHGVRIGSGVTPATIDDYTIEEVITDFAVTNPSGISVNSENGYVEATATYGIYNYGANAFTISEICLFGDMYGEATSTNKFLLDRTVLENPITVNPGQTKQVTYTIRMNYPT